MMTPVGLLLILVNALVCQEAHATLEGVQQFLNNIHLLQNPPLSVPAVSAVAASSVLPGASSYIPIQQEGYASEWGTGLCDEQCTCGVPNRSTRIIGGKPTQVNEFPWVAALQKNGRIFCGATVITDRHVLTAAHCVQGNIFMLRLSTLVILSEHDTTESDESPMDTRRIATVYRHPDFRPSRGNYDGDLALVLMSTPVMFNAHLAPACLPSPGEDYAGLKGTVAGWGRTAEKGKPSHELLAVDVPILSQDNCRRHSIYETDKLTDHMMCAGRIEGGADSCQGDSGGALVVTDAMNRMVTAGIVSWGEGCARPYRPGVYTRVNHYLTWIQRNTKDACFCA